MNAPYTVTIDLANLRSFLVLGKQPQGAGFSVEGDLIDKAMTDDHNAAAEKMRNGHLPEKLIITGTNVSISHLHLPKEMAVEFANAADVSMTWSNFGNLSLPMAKNVKLMQTTLADMTQTDAVEKADISFSTLHTLPLHYATNVSIKNTTMKKLDLGPLLDDLCLHNCKGFAAQEPHALKEIKGGYLSASLNFSPNMSHTEILFYNTESRLYHAVGFKGEKDALLNRCGKLSDSLNTDAGAKYLDDVNDFVDKVHARKHKL